MTVWKAVTIWCLMVLPALSRPDSKAISKQHEHATVATPLGTIEGSVLSTRGGKTIYAFRGIRYAKAPVEDLRFQPPVPIEKWEGIFNASVDGPACPQPSNPHTSEDCLLLNVYSTKLPKATEQEDKRPVLVYFHGGAFSTGAASSSILSPNYLLDHDIVLVVPGYRLGALGFLSTGDKEASGNAGLKDQVQALKWVKDNIAPFGGNPDNVTIAGSGAGAISVTLHLVSPLSKNLFHKAIAMSGSALGNCPVPQNQLDLVKSVSRLVGCPDDSSSSMVKCLKTKPVDTFSSTVDQLKEFAKQDPSLVFLPVVEHDSVQNRFLTAHPVELVLSGQFQRVPFLTGVTTDEKASHAFGVIGPKVNGENKSYAQELTDNFENLAPIAFLYERKGDNSAAISKDLKKFYFDDKPIDNTSLAGLVQIYSDGLVGFGVNRAVKLLAEKSNESVYYYRFNFKGRHSHFYLPDSNGTVPYGAVNLDDLIYLFQCPDTFKDYKPEDPETSIIDKMTKLWTNFVITGKPAPEQNEALDNVKWEPFTTKTEKYLDIGNKLNVQEKLNDKRYAEWNRLFPLSKYEKKKHQG